MVAKGSFRLSTFSELVTFDKRDIPETPAQVGRTQRQLDESQLGLD